ncbi:MAG: serpin family protein [Oligoflexales bacterium]|nr:serpin family protein [Oligoflexales bacterium]
MIDSKPCFPKEEHLMTKRSVFKILCCALLSLSPCGLSPAAPRGKGERLMEESVKKMNRSSFLIFKNLLEEQRRENIIFSPLSIQKSLSLLYPAAAESSDIRNELASLLVAPGRNDEEFYRWNRSYLAHVNAIFDKRYPKKRFEGEMASTLWISKAFDVNEKYQSIVKDNFSSDIIKLDFTSSDEQREVARLAINDFVREKTNEFIRDLVPKGAITEKTAIVLTNAIYLLADWQDEFQGSMTSREDFSITADTKKSVKMMKKVSKIDYFENRLLKAVSLPYMGGELAMLVILPKKPSDFPSLQKHLDEALIENIMDGLLKKQVSLWLPKFEYIWGSHSLKNALVKSGVKKIFSYQPNNFPGLLSRESPFSDYPISVTDIFHQARIIVDERGTEAAAATAMTVELTSLTIKKEKPVEFKVNRPAYFFIYDTKYNGIMFIGTLTDP